MAEEPRYFFVHLQKTGGTALFQRLRACFGPYAVYPTPDDTGGVQSVTDLDHLASSFAKRRDTLRVVTGHFPLCAARSLGGSFRTFTLLRDPVERTLSLLRRRSMADDRFLDWRLEQIYEDGSLRDIIENHMTKMLSLSEDEVTTIPLMAHVAFDEDRLNLAKHNLEHEIDIFGLQEGFDEFCGDLEAHFGWDLGPPRFANRTQRSPVSDELRERIAADNRYDVELYRFAAELLQDRRRRVVPRA